MSTYCSLMAKSKKQRRNSAIMSSVVESVATSLTAALNAADTFNHQGSGGTHREDALRTALGQLLTDRYVVGSGEAFDCHDNVSRQLDLVIARRSHMTAALGGAGGTNSYPCETILAVTEAKKRVGAQQIDEALNNAASLRSLKPFGDQAFVDARTGGASADKNEHRLMHCVFAMDTDLVPGPDWAKRELDRLVTRSDLLRVQPKVIDRLFILSRGIINVVDRKAMAVDSAAELTFAWFFHIANHVDREDRRRPEFDMDHYRLSTAWETC